MRKVRIEDIGAIARLARDEVEEGLRWTWTPTRLAKTLARPNNLCVVASRGDELLGFAIARYGFEQVHLLLLAVDPQHRGEGTGTALMKWHTACARVAGLTRIRLEVRANNTLARCFYESLDFAVTGRVSRYYQGLEDALIMEQKLTTDPAA